MTTVRLDKNPTGHHVTLSVPIASTIPSGGSTVINVPRRPPVLGVMVKDGRKAYGNRPPILNNYNMNVPKGTIYGLLGSSGCGKTTILSCIVGLRKLDAGELLVMGGKPGTVESGIPGPAVGYMPQDIALYENFTIKEVLQYYGRIYGMSQSDIIKRMEYLMGFLDLPEANRIIGTLSGGQQRRTSLAVALVHQPELLILDEPTVGVDPLVREKIWEHICNMAATKKTTVIVTTHYIEEARQAHTVGLMRNGRLLTEKAPNALLEEHNADLLEDIVLKLCKKDNMGLIDGNPSDEVTQALQEISFYTGKKNLSIAKGQAPSIAADRSPIVGLKFKRRYTEENMMHQRGSLKRQQSVADMMHGANEYLNSRGDRIRALILRNYITFFRNILFMVGVLFIPSVQIIISNFVIGYEPKNMNFGLVNHEVPESNFTDICPFETGCLAEGLSCRYVHALPPDQINMIRAETEEDALYEIHHGKMWGYLSIPDNFTAHMKDRALSRNFATNETLEGTTLSIRMDMSHYLGGALLTKTFYETFQKFFLDVVSDCEQDARLADIPINYRTPIYGSLETGYQEFIAPAELLLVLLFVPLASGGIAYIKDKKAGTLDRSMVAGVTTFDVLIAFMVTEGSLIIIQTLLSFLILVVGFGLEIQGSSILFIIICLLTGITGLSLGFLIAMMVDEEMEAVIIALGLYAPIMILSGIIWPLNGVPTIMFYISHALPCTYATEAIRSIVSRGWGFTHSHVWPGFLTLFLWIFVSWCLTALVHRRRNK